GRRGDRAAHRTRRPRAGRPAGRAAAGPVPAAPGERWSPPQGSVAGQGDRRPPRRHVPRPHPRPPPGRDAATRGVRPAGRRTTSRTGGTVSTTLGQVIAVLEAAYPPHTAESWDAVGLVCGDP